MIRAMRKNIVITMQPWELANLDRLARAAGMSRSAFIRWMVCEQIAAGGLCPQCKKEEKKARE